MRKFSFAAALLLAVTMTAGAQTINVPDTAKIPVILVDGVEVTDLNELDSNDIVEMRVVKDKEITKIFAPRTGGVIMITTKSKKYLKPLLEKARKEATKIKPKTKPGEIMIR